MLMKKLPGSEPWTDPDDAPELTPELLADAEVYEADQFVRRARGRPLSDARKEKINVRLDPAVLEHLRKDGPGWQTHINRVLMLTTGVDTSMWSYLEGAIGLYEKDIAHLLFVIGKQEDGSMRSYTNNVDTTVQSLERHRQLLATLHTGLEAMQQVQLDLFRAVQSNLPEVGMD